MANTPNKQSNNEIIMSAFQQLDNILKHADADSQDWTEWQVNVADEIVQAFEREDTDFLEGSWRSKEKSWKEAMIDVIDGLPHYIFVPILLEIIRVEDDDLGWKAADACGFYAKRKEVVAELTAVKSEKRALCVERLNSFIEKGYLRTGNGEEIHNLRNLLL